jgi:hypothetical protein
MDQATPSTASANTLHCALELSKKSWLLEIQFPDREQPAINSRRGMRSEQPSKFELDIDSPSLAR